MKQITLLIAILSSFASHAKKDIIWTVPLNSENKIVYSGTFNVKDISKATIFRRLKKFVAIEDFDKVENIKCKDKSVITTKFYEKSIRYEDSIDGIIIGNGYMPVLWRRFNYLWVVYEFKIIAKDGVCKYEITGFTAINFFAAPKVKSRGSAFATGSYGYLFGSSSSTSTMNATKMQSVPLEKYIDGMGEGDSYNTYFRDSPDIFTNEMKSVVKTLKESISNEF